MWRWALVVLAGCVELASGTSSVPPLDLTIDVSTEADESFQSPDGTTSTTETYTKRYLDVASRPDAVVIPATIQGTKVVVPLSINCATPGLETQNVRYISIGRLDQFGVVGIYHWECTYGAGNVSQGMKDLGELYDPNDPAPAL